MNDPGHTVSPARRFGDVAGAAYLAVGVVGFAVTGLSDFAAPQGARLLMLEVNPLHNLLPAGGASAWDAERRQARRAETHQDVEA